jgi:hypothetical protein
MKKSVSDKMDYSPYPERFEPWFVDEWGFNHSINKLCPYGGPGDKLWVREAFSPCVCKACECVYPVLPRLYHPPNYRATYKGPSGIIWKPSIHMPHWASRITLEIVNVRVERLQEISADDVFNEGVDYLGKLPHPALIKPDNVAIGKLITEIAHMEFQKLWNSINGKKHPWEQNPWVWVLEFKVLNGES